MIKMNEETYKWLRDEDCGICLSCFTVRHGETEPDAENYPCDNCGRMRVQGIDNILVCGLVDIDEDVTEPIVHLKNRKTGEKSTRPVII